MTLRCHCHFRVNSLKDTCLKTQLIYQSTSGAENSLACLYHNYLYKSCFFRVTRPSGLWTTLRGTRNCRSISQMNTIWGIIFLPKLRRLAANDIWERRKISGLDRHHQEASGRVTLLRVRFEMNARCEFVCTTAESYNYNYLRRYRPIRRRWTHVAVSNDAETSAFKSDRGLHLVRSYKFPLRFSRPGFRTTTAHDGA